MGFLIDDLNTLKIGNNQEIIKELIETKFPQLTVTLSMTDDAFVVIVERENFEISDDFRSDVVNFLHDLYLELSNTGVAEYICSLPKKISR